MHISAKRMAILREHIHAGIEYALDVAQHALEIRRQRLHGGAGIAYCSTLFPCCVLPRTILFGHAGSPFFVAARR